MAGYARAYTVLSRTHVRTYLEPLDDDYLNPAGLDLAHRLALKAVQLDPENPQVSGALSLTYLVLHRWDDARAYDRGKVLSGEELETAREFGRYDDVDGDGIPHRTLPGTHPTRGAYFTRGTSRDRFARYTEESGPYVDNMERLLRKFETARSLLPRPVLKPAAKAEKA